MPPVTAAKAVIAHQSNAVRSYLISGSFSGWPRTIRIRLAGNVLAVRLYRSAAEL
jgi:hypothetical protein